MMQSLPLSQRYLVYLSFIMLGYMALNKGFAYTGYNPLFIGEITLALGFLTILAGGGTVRIFRSPIIWALIAFMAWNAFRTLPYVTVYGVDTLRDAILWAYGLFTFMIAALLLRTNAVERVPDWFAAVFPFVLIIGPVAHLITELFYDAMPKWPGSDASVIMVKAGDLGVQIAGIIAFLAVGLHTVYPRQGRTFFQIKDLYYWGAAGLATMLVLSRSRGGFVGIVLALAIVYLFRPSNRVGRSVAPLAVIGVLLVVFDVTVPLGGGREFSVQQVVTNALSIVTDQDEDVLDNTESWRLIWWESIINDTMFGDKFWMGRGYGISHAVADGYVQDSGNRSPHNATINYLGRGGVPGLILWLILNITLFWTLMQCYFRAKRTGRKDLASINLWIMAWWAAFMGYSSFEVYLEAPQGGIPYWALVGFAVALTEAQRGSYAAQPARPRRTPAPPASHLSEPPPHPPPRRTRGPGREALDSLGARRRPRRL